MHRHVSRKWRPSLALVVGGTLAGVLVLPILGLIALPLVGPTVVVLGVLLATAILGYLLWRLILRPIRALSAQAEAVASGEARVPDPLPRYGTAEIGHLAGATLAMAESLHAREAAVRAYTDHVTHELRTPLAAIRGSVELLEDMGVPPDVAARLTAIREAESRMEHLLDAARRIAAAREPLPEGETTLGELKTELQAVAPIALDIEGADRLLPLPKEALGVILGQLIRNASEAGASRVRVTAGTDARIDVADDGAGISDGNRARLFEPFFTTRRDAGGTGMGLAIAAAMLSAGGGRIEALENAPGAHFRITL